MNEETKGTKSDQAPDDFPRLEEELLAPLTNTSLTHQVAPEATNAAFQLPEFPEFLTGEYQLPSAAELESQRQADLQGDSAEQISISSEEDFIPFQESTLQSSLPSLLPTLPSSSGEHQTQFFTLVLSNVVREQDRQDLEHLLKDCGFFADSKEAEVMQQQLEQGELYLPGLTQFMAVTLAQRLRFLPIRLNIKRA